MKKILTKKMILLVASVAILAGIGGYFYFSGNNDSKSESNVNKINYGPPTEEEKAAGDQQKAENITKEKNTGNATPSSTAQIVVVDANQYFENVEVRAYISNQYEDGGKCTAVFTKDNETVQQSSNAFKDATTTQCETIEISKSKFLSTGNWQLVVKYSSPNSSGSTAPQTVSIK